MMGMPVVKEVKVRRIRAVYRAAQKLVDAEANPAAGVDTEEKLLADYNRAEQYAFRAGATSKDLPILEEMKAGSDYLETAPSEFSEAEAA